MTAIPAARLTVGIAAIVLSCCPSHADAATAKPARLTLFGDSRLRLERDWDSKQPNGVPRADRDRLRLRLRVGATYDSTPTLSFGTRLRTGSINSQQSPHVTIYDFQDNPLGNRDVVFDLWYARWAARGSAVWVGRNSFPFWKQNEMFWDDDVTPAGVAATYTTKKGKETYAFNAGYLFLPDGAHDFLGKLTGLQIVHTQKVRAMDLTAAGGLFLFAGKSGAKRLRNGNGSRDYDIWVGNLQGKWMVHKKPLALGFDYMHNSKSYSATDPNAFTVANRNERDGYVAYAEWGQTKKSGDWLLGYYYAHIESLAVNACYAQDDWVRFGSADQTDSSNIQGHELRVGFGLSKDSNLFLRLFLVEAITNAQDGKRIRLDFNTRF